MKENGETLLEARAMRRELVRCEEERLDAERHLSEPSVRDVIERASDSDAWAVRISAPPSQRRVLLTSDAKVPVPAVGSTEAPAPATQARRQVVSDFDFLALTAANVAPSPSRIELVPERVGDSQPRSGGTSSGRLRPLFPAFDFVALREQNDRQVLSSASSSRAGQGRADLSAIEGAKSASSTRRRDADPSAFDFLALARANDFGSEVNGSRFALGQTGESGDEEGQSGEEVR